MPKRPPTLSHRELRQAVFPPETHIVGNGILKKNSKLIVAAAPKSYKSFMFNTILIQLLTGGHLFGAYKVHARQREDVFHIHPVNRVLLIEQELGLEDNRDRFLPYYKSLPPDQREIVDNNLFIHSCNLDLRLDEKAGYEQMVEVIGEIKPQVVVFDPLIKFHRQNENDPSVMNAVMCQMTSLQQDLDFSSMIVHHNNKNGEAVGLNKVRGGSSIVGDLDTIMMVDIWNRSAAIIRVDVILKRGKPINPFLLQLNPTTLRMEFKEWYRGKSEPQPESETIQ